MEKLTPAGICISTGGLGLMLSALWWKNEFDGETQFLSCMWYWGLECSLATVVALGGGKAINYSPIVFWVSAVTVGVGVILMLLNYGKGPDAGTKA
jgi:hypothetical protein